MALRSGEDAPQWFWKGVTDPEPHVRLATAHHLDVTCGIVDNAETRIYSHPASGNFLRRSGDGAGAGYL